MVFLQEIILRGADSGEWPGADSGVWPGGGSGEWPGADVLSTYDYIVPAFPILRSFSEQPRA